MVKRTPGKKSAPLKERILAGVVVRDDGCWVWRGSHTSDGYGRIKVPRVGVCYAHRVAYEQWVGPVPEGLILDHLCRVRDCCRPEHLEPVTIAVNNRRGAVTRTHCKRGHAYSGPSLRITPDGRRECRNCRRLRKGLSLLGETEVI